MIPTRGSTRLPVKQTEHSCAQLVFSGLFAFVRRILRGHLFKPLRDGVPSLNLSALLPSDQPLDSGSFQE